MEGCDYKTTVPGEPGRNKIRISWGHSRDERVSVSEYKQIDTVPTFLSPEHQAERSWVPLVQLGLGQWSGQALFSPARTDAFQVTNQHCLCTCSAHLAMCDEQSAYWLSQQLPAPPPSPHVDPQLLSAGCSFFPIKEEYKGLSILFPSPKIQFPLS